MLDHSAEAVGAIGVLVLDMATDGVGFVRVDGLRNEIAIGPLAVAGVEKQGSESNFLLI
ncbi:MAG TPA: hypothetical protein VF264_01760 [Rhodanobacteraceae bacterium]